MRAKRAVVAIVGFAWTLGCGHAGPGSDVALADGGVVTATDDFSIALDPTTMATAAGAAVRFRVTTTITAGVAQKVNLSISGLPPSIEASFNPSAIDSGGSAVLTLTPSSSSSAGSYDFTLTGTGTSATRSIAGSVTIAPDFSIVLHPSTQSTTPTNSAIYNVVTAALGPAAPTIDLTTLQLPSGITALFNPRSVTAGRNSTLTLKVGKNIAKGTYHFKVNGKAGPIIHVAAGTIKVN